MSDQLSGSDLQREVPIILSHLLDNNLELASQEVARVWQHSRGDHRVVVATALILMSAKNFDGLANLLSTLDPRFFNHSVLSSLRELVDQNGGSRKPEGSLEQFTQFLERARNLDISEDDLGYKRSSCPILTELNGDPFWIFADLLPYLWHVVELPLKSQTPKILAETQHYKWVSDRLSPGDVVYDVGANMGLFTNMMSRRVGERGKVCSFEPNPPVFEDLKRIVILNQLNNVDLYPVAASDSEGAAVFNQILAGDVNREASGLVQGGEATGQLRSAISVATTTLDVVIGKTQRAPSLVKIDVEGAEFQVLRGMQETLANCHPKLVIEFHPDANGNFDDTLMRSLLTPHGYRINVSDKNYYCE